MAHPKNSPAAAPTAGRSNDAGFGNRINLTQTSSRPQLHRHGDTSTVLAFVDAPDGSPIGWLARGKGGWNAVRTGTGDAYVFASALRAMRYVCGGRP